MRLLLAASIATVACSSTHRSGSVDAQPDASIYTGPCMMTVTGLPLQVTTYACTTTTVWTASTNQSRFEIDPIDFPPGLRFGDAISWPGTPAATSYHSDEVGVGGGVTIAETAPMMPSDWTTSNSGPSGNGGFALTLAGIGTAMPTSDGSAYTVHGDLTATLVGPTVVMVSARF